jgi:fructokinase
MAAARDTPTVGAIEAGGTKFRCALARGVDVLVSRRIETTTPAATLAAVVDFFVEAQAAFEPALAFGIGSFGPIDVDRRSPRYGCILPTPKPGWAGVDLADPLIRRFGRPVAVDTDVNAAALAESTLGAGRGLASLAYVTVGTGIGGGLIVDGRPVHGLLHPEMGHIAVRRDPRDLSFAGICPFHGDCLEGLASGPAIQARWSRPLDAIPADADAPAIIGGYLGQLAANIALMVSSERVVFGGGVMSSGAVLPYIRARARGLLNGYLTPSRVRDSLDDYITAPDLGELSGLIGALLLAIPCAADQRSAPAIVTP